MLHLASRRSQFIANSKLSRLTHTHKHMHDLSSSTKYCWRLQARRLSRNSEKLHLCRGQASPSDVSNLETPWFIVPCPLFLLRSFPFRSDGRTPPSKQKAPPHAQQALPRTRSPGLVRQLKAQLAAQDLANFWVPGYTPNRPLRTEVYTPISKPFGGAGRKGSKFGSGHCGDVL